jgi:hypothetical protein
MIVWRNLKHIRDVQPSEATKDSLKNGPSFKGGDGLADIVNSGNDATSDENRLDPSGAKRLTPTGNLGGVHDKGADNQTVKVFWV